MYSQFELIKVETEYDGFLLLLNIKRNRYQN
jgi:hypothetical protein